MVISCSTTTVRRTRTSTTRSRQYTRNYPIQFPWIIYRLAKRTTAGEEMIFFVVYIFEWKCLHKIYDDGLSHYIVIAQCLWSLNYCEWVKYITFQSSTNTGKIYTNLFVYIMYILKEYTHHTLIVWTWSSPRCSPNVCDYDLFPICTIKTFHLCCMYREQCRSPLQCKIMRSADKVYYTNIDVSTYT